ncbi:MAG: xanthine dehydrogenase family protein, partial [Alphaproteobacteria bacterium]|nr:xanthine dehydrogenase family protein [Alphaproteobacteria bacterium]
MEHFGIGQPVRRKEDFRFLTGAGRYTDDINLPGQAHAHILRSPHAHARITRLDTAAAAAAPGVIAVLTQADVAADGLPPLPCQVDVPGKDGTKMFVPPRTLLADGCVRYVGDPVALVVAESAVAARDAAELIAIDYDALPAVADTAAAAGPDAALVWPEHGSNLCVHWQSHDGTAMQAAFARAARVVRCELVNNRLVGNPMEPRVAIGDYDAATGVHTLHSPTQGVVRVWNGLAGLVFNLPKDKVRVVSPDVGGGFGLRGKLFPESCLVVWAARRLGRPVKWTADRSETFLSDPHGRDHVTTCEMAFDADARILAMRAETVANVGAYLLDLGPRIPTVAGARIAGSVYDVPAMQLSVRVVFTNTVPTDSYRGAGRPEICYQMERLLDLGAAAFGLGREEIRRRNFIRPEQLPYRNQVGMVIDSGLFAQTMDLALAKADWSGFPARRRESERRGRRRGIGLGYYVEASGGVPSEEARVRFEADGRVSLIVGTFSHGQGHETAYAQILAERLGVPFESIDLRQGDSDFVKFGNGTGGSRSSQMGGVATSRAGHQVIEKARRIAAHALEAAEADIRFADGAFAVPGTDLRITIQEVARLAREPGRLPEGMAPGLDETCRYERPTECNFPNGAHIAEVEIDPDTGVVDIVRYVCVDDCGVIINPLLIAGQVHGAVAQGLGQALLELAAYDRDSGQLVAGSFMDYAMPRASDMPDLEVDFHVVRNPSNDLGV